MRRFGLVGHIGIIKKGRVQVVLTHLSCGDAPYSICSGASVEGNQSLMYMDDLIFVHQ